MTNKEKFQSRVQRFGLVLAALFFIVSVIMVIRNHGGLDVLTSDTQVITFAHWQLEDGFREGIDEAIKLYEAEKAKQGVKVKVRQVAVPVRGYGQWFLTQLIGGEPADLMELLGGSDLHNRYFVPLSPYINEPNPWNAGTPLERYSWRESFSDDMISSFDTNYSEFFGVNIFMYTTRVYVNMDLYRAACPGEPLPKNVTEWLEACRKLKEYGAKIGKPVIPIGVRGFDKSTLAQLISSYNDQLNSAWSDNGSTLNYGVRNAELFQKINEGTFDRKELLTPFEVVSDIGHYFADGFSAIDLEQTKYLFASGLVGFFIDGTYNAWSMVNNSPFEVEIIRIPVIARRHRLGARSVGEVTELGYGIGGKMGISRRAKNFELTLDFLRFLTSYNISRMTMVEHCKWLTPLKEMKYEGLLKKTEPVSQTEYMPIGIPFELGTHSRRIMLQSMEQSIMDGSPDAGEIFWRKFLSERRQILDELREGRYGISRTLWSMDSSASALRLGSQDPALAKDEREQFVERANINLEGMVGRFVAIDHQDQLMAEISKLKEEQ